MDVSSCSTSLYTHSVKPRIDTIPVFDKADIGLPVTLETVVDDWKVEAVLERRPSDGRRADKVQKKVSTEVKLGDGRHGPAATTSTVRTKTTSDDTGSELISIPFT